MSDYLILEERSLLANEVRLLKDEIKSLKAENASLRETQKLGAAEMHGLHDAYLGKLRESTAFLEGLNRQLSKVGEVVSSVISEGAVLDERTQSFVDHYSQVDTQVRQMDKEYRVHLTEFISATASVSQTIESAGKETLTSMKEAVALFQNDVAGLFQQILSILSQPHANEGLEREVLQKLNQRLG